MLDDRELSFRVILLPDGLAWPDCFDVSPAAAAFVAGESIVW
jgi:hypothetical protein